MLSLLSNRETYILAHGAEYLAGKSFFRRCIWPTYRRFILRNASCVIANSHYTETLVKHCSPNAKTIAIPLAVDAIHFRPTCENIRMACYTSVLFLDWKNLKDMILLSGR